MKKIFSLLLIIAFVFLCSCSKTSEENITTTTEFEEFTSQTTAEYVTKTKGFFYTDEIKTDASDPYSYIIKKRCEEVLNAWETTTWYDDNAEDFEKFIKNRYNVYYFLYDLNGDGTDELLLGGWGKTDYKLESKSPKSLFITDIYAIKNGEALRLSGDTFFGRDYTVDQVLLSNGVILIEWGNKESPNYIFVSYTGDDLHLDVAVTSLKNNFYSKNTQEGTLLKEKTITQKEYERIYEENYGDNERIEINWKRIDEYGK